MANHPNCLNTPTPFQTQWVLYHKTDKAWMVITLSTNDVGQPLLNKTIKIAVRKDLGVLKLKRLLTCINHPRFCLD